MTTTAKNPVSPRVVDPAAARRILEMACSKGVGFAFCPTDSTPKAQLAGRFAGMGTDGATLVVGLDAALESVSTGDTFDFWFRIATQGFAFQAALVGTNPNAERAGAVFGYPAALEAVDRRGAPRLRLRDRSIVAVKPLDSPSSRVVRGSLMNLSATGLAFLLPAAPPKALAVGVDLQATLEGGATNDPLSLPARIVSVTQGGDQRSWVVGIEFTQDEQSSELGDRLAQWLELPKQE